MSLIYNGTTIKAINYNGTALKKVIINGVTVWTASTPYYAIQNGSLVNCPNASGGCTGDGGLYHDSGTITYDGHSFYGGGCHSTVEGSVAVYSNTGNMSTNGCKYLKLTIYENVWGMNDVSSYTDLTVYGNGNSIYTKRFDNLANNTQATVTIDVSAYSNARAYLKTQDLSHNDNQNGWWLYAGFINVQFTD